MTDEQWTTAEAAEFCHVKPSRFRALVADFQITAVDSRRTKPRAQPTKFYRADDIRRMQKTREERGQGYRSDLHGAQS